MMFVYEHVVKLHDTDGYGIIFFANQLRMCHDALQACWRHIGYPMLPLRSQLPVLPVIVHAESDYRAKVVVDDVLRIEITLETIGTTSFALRYRLTNQRGTETGAARTVHVTIDPATDGKMPVPEVLRAALARI
jgi:1,4-dihydroxy-2-naphthoyl-CoA hydrolase